MTLKKSIVFNTHMIKDRYSFDNSLFEIDSVSDDILRLCFLTSLTDIFMNFNTIKIST